MIEKLKLFFSKAKQYESSVLTNRNCAREHQPNFFCHTKQILAIRRLSESVKKFMMATDSYNQDLQENKEFDRFEIKLYNKRQ